MNLVALGGVASIIVGVATRSYFAMGEETLPGFLRYEPLLEPLDEVMTLLIISVALGVVQVSLGVIVNAIRRAREGDLIGALSVEITTLALFVAIGVVVAIPQTVGWLLPAAFGAAVVFKGRILEEIIVGRSAKRALIGFGRGLLGLYGLVGICIRLPLLHAIGCPHAREPSRGLRDEPARGAGIGHTVRHRSAGGRSHHHRRPHLQRGHQPAGRVRALDAPAVRRVLRPVLCRGRKGIRAFRASDQVSRAAFGNGCAEGRSTNVEDLILGIPGLAWAYFGAALAAIGGGIGSAIGISTIANTATGIITEDSEKFGRVLPLAAMPGTQGVYGFITALLVFIFFGFFAGEAELTAVEGFRICLACTPVAFLCLFSGIYQGAAAVGSAGMIARRDEDAGKALIFPALVETYAVFSLILTVLMLLMMAD
jgi:V/A-type H+/Na+-transporting ATPase subunit K